MMIFKRLKYLWPPRRRREEREMREELESLAAMAGRGELGNLTLAMENVRGAWGWTWLDSFVADIRYSFRALRSQPGFVAVAIFSLALAIGAATAIFSFADALLLRPLPVLDAPGLFDVSYTTPDNPLEGLSFPDYRDLHEKSHSFTGLAAYRLTQVAASANPLAPARIRLAALYLQRPDESRSALEPGRKAHSLCLATRLRVFVLVGPGRWRPMIRSSCSRVKRLCSRPHFRRTAGWLTLLPAEKPLPTFGYYPWIYVIPRILSPARRSRSCERPPPNWTQPFHRTAGG